MVACDQGKQHDENPVRGGAITVVASNLASGTLAQNGTVRVRFNRYLLPSSVTRQSVLLIDGLEQSVPSPIVTYDPVTLTVSLSSSDATTPWLTPGQPYKIILPLADETSTHETLRAIDGAGLDPAASRTIGFTASDSMDPPSEPAAPAVNFCTDVFPVFVSKCATGTACHADPAGTQNPATSLVLLSPEGVRNTAVGRVAQGANTGARAGIGSAPGRVFGVDMPLIDPSNPGNSWLLYKTLLAPLPLVDPAATSKPLRCRTQAGELADPVAITAESIAPSDSERAVLNDSVAGREMPYPPSPGPLSYATRSLSFEERARLRLWIAQGAVVEACGTCE